MVVVVVSVASFSVVYCGVVAVVVVVIVVVKL